MSTPTVLRDLREREAAARQRRDYHHQQFDRALARLKALGAHCPGVECRGVEAAGLALSTATRGHVQTPFMGFADALLEYARTNPVKDQGGAVKRLATQAMDQMRELAHHIDREARAQREIQLFRHTLAATDEAATTRRTGP